MLNVRLEIQSLLFYIHSGDVCIEYTVQLRNAAIYPSYFVNAVLVDVSAIVKCYFI